MVNHSFVSTRSGFLFLLLFFYMSLLSEHPASCSGALCMFAQYVSSTKKKKINNQQQQREADVRFNFLFLNLTVAILLCPKGGLFFFFFFFCRQEKKIKK